MDRAGRAHHLEADGPTRGTYVRLGSTNSVVLCAGREISSPRIWLFSGMSTNSGAMKTDTIRITPEMLALLSEIDELDRKSVV